jgi:hypothetical protein
MKKFFRRIHLKFVQWFATFFLRHADKSIRRLLVLNRAYQDLSYLVVPLLSLTNDVVRQQVINVGKNPDLITITPNPMAEDGVVVSVAARDQSGYEQEAKAWENGVPPGENPHWIMDLKQRPSMRALNNFGSEYVRNPKEHPVLKTRATWYAKQNPEVIDVNINITSSPQATEAITTQVNTEALNVLRDAVRDIESTLQPAEADDKKSE